MARIKKRGLDYFPLDTDFINNRVVRRIMKREGDRALGILVTIYSYIYADEGYFLQLDANCLDDLATNLYDAASGDVERVVREAVDGGLFDAGLYERQGILTSAHIQRQYVFIKKQRKDKLLRPDLCLLPTDGEPSAEAGKDEGREAISAVSPEKTAFSSEFDPQRKVKHSKAEQSKEHPLEVPPPDGATKGGMPEEDVQGSATRERKLCTAEDIDRLVPPSDGVKRNYEGLLSNLRLYGIPPDEQWAIIRRSNFGAIGHSVWRGLSTLRESGGKIKLPGRYLLSLR